MESTIIPYVTRRALSGVLLVLLASCGGGDGGSAPVASTAATASPPALSAATTTNLTLAGAQEVPPNGSTATGIATMIVDPGSKQFSATATTQGMVGTAAHIHDGAPGVAGPIIFPMTQTSSGSGVWTVSGQLTDAQLATFNAGRYYINVHSAALPNGEIRGQIVPAVAPLTGSSGGGGAGGGSGY